MSEKVDKPHAEQYTSGMMFTDGITPADLAVRRLAPVDRSALVRRTVYCGSLSRAAGALGRARNLRLAAGRATDINSEAHCLQLGAGFLCEAYAEIGRALRMVSHG